MTVSMALRDSPSVAQATRDRVFRTAEELGYTRDPIMSSAMETLRRSAHQRNHVVVAFVTHDPGEAWREVPTLREYHQGITARAEALGFDVQVFSRHEAGVSDRELADLLCARGIRSLIMAPLPPERMDEQIDFPWERFSAVTVGNSLARPAIHRACSNHFHAAETAYARVADRGYTRIALAISKDEDRRSGGKLHGGYLKSQADHGHGPLPAYVPEKWTQEGFVRWLAETRPEAVIGLGASLQPWIESAGKRVPQDIGCANLSLDARMAAAGLSGIRHLYVEIGAASLNLLAGALVGNEQGPPELPTMVDIDGDWHPGNTLRERD